MTDMVTELTRPVDRAQLDQDIEDFNISYPVNVDDALGGNQSERRKDNGAIVLEGHVSH